MFEIAPRHARDFRRAQLLLSTALIGLAPLALMPGAGFAQAYLDDVTGDDTIDPSPSVTWGADSAIWQYENEPDHRALDDGDVGILTKPGGGAVTVTIDGTVRPGGLRVESGDYTLTGGEIAAVDADAEVVLEAGSDLTLTVDSALSGAIRIGGQGTVDYAGDSAGMTRLDVDAGANFRSEGNTAGQMQVDGTARLGGEHNGDVAVASGGALSAAGIVTGAVENSGAVDIDGALSVLRLVNQAGGTLSLNGGDVLTSAQPVVNSESAILRLDGDSRIAGDLENHGLIEKTAGNARLAVDGSFSNRGQLDGSGGGVLTIVAEQILLGVGSAIDTAMIDLVGFIENAGQLDFTDDTTLDDGLTNLAGGAVGVSADVDAAGHDVGNDGSFEVQADGRLHGVGTLANSADFDIRQGGAVQAGTAINAAGGRMNIAGRLEAAVENQLGAVLDLQGGGIDGALDNAGELTGTGEITGALANTGSATIGGSVGDVENSGTLTTAGNLSVASLTNTGDVGIGGADRLLSQGDVDNSGHIAVEGTLEVAGADARISNSGTLGLDGANIVGNVENAAGGRIEMISDSSVRGGLTNYGTIDMTSGAGDVRLSVTEGRFSNSGRVTVSGTGSLTIEADDIELEEGSDIDGSLVELVGTVTNQGNLTYSEDATLNGDLRNGSNGHVRVTADLDAAGHDVHNAGSFVVDSDADSTGHLRNVDALTNSGSFAIAADSSVSAATAENRADGTMTIAGALDADLTNREDATVVMQNGRVVGRLDNAGTLRGSGSIEGMLDNSGALEVAGDLVVAGLDNRDTGIARIDAGDRLESAGTVGNAGQMTVDGALAAALSNQGALIGTGTIDGNVVNSGEMDWGGALGGSLTNHAALRTTGDVTVAEALVNGPGAAGGPAGLTVAQGHTMTVAGGVVNNLGGVLGLSGILAGDVANNGTVNALGDQGSITGALINDGTVSLATDGQVGSLLQLGGLSGTGTYVLDLDLDAMTADRIVVQGGATTGRINLAFSFAGSGAGTQPGQRITLLDVDQSFGSANDFRYAYDLTDLPSGRLVYSVEQAGSFGNLELVGQTSPGIGALFGNVTLIQSLIGSVVNRPTSPFVTGLAYEDRENPCGTGAWARLMGGHATASGATDNGVSNIESTIHAHYYGMQVGGDLACSDDRFGGWDMAFGVIGGVNQGDTRQPVHAIDPDNAQSVTDRVISTTSADFTQAYGGVYATATRGRFQADLQYRYETTDFTIRNRAIPGAGGDLGLDDTDFGSTAHTLSGSVGYAIPVGKAGWVVVPTAGFAWSRLSTDSIRFDDDYRLSFEDSERRTGFVGTTVARTFVQPARNEALYAFATGTYYKDFADSTVSVFSNDTDPGFAPQRLVSDHLGAYGELSFGANYIKVLSETGRGRQFSSSARIDARFGGGLDSVGVTGQLRWQF
ncbi:beta strand repeat-containing protein [Paracoccus alkenifer]|nr:autotransporter outer membrane beta-barrel domain-containing protein [Paracoccus alkenifer]